MRAINWLKKFIALMATALALTVVIVPNLAAQGDSTSLLQLIANNTSGILQQVNTAPSTLSNVLQSLATYITSWTSNDTSKFTTQAQGIFGNIGASITNSTNAQLGMQPQLLATQLSPLPPSAPFTTANIKAPSNAPNSILSILPNVNDLSYASLLGTPPSPKAPNAAQSPYNYVVNASGITLAHVMPGLNWQGNVSDQAKYRNYYNTIMASESFNAYVLSNQYAQSQNNNGLIAAQNQLISLATSTNWFTSIASQELGVVLRQILMFESQNYVLMTQFMQIQNQLLAAQVMTNSLLIASAQNTETLLVSKAQGVSPQ